MPRGEKHKFSYLKTLTCGGPRKIRCARIRHIAIGSVCEKSALYILYNIS